MIRLHILGEGPTERRFVESLFVNHLIHHDVIVDVCCFLTKFVQKTGRPFKGGISNYGKVRDDIVRRLREDQNNDSRFTTMIDFYGLPSDFPGFEQAKSITDPYAKVRHIETAFAQDINDPRFLPYIQLHEFEALLFANPEKLGDEYIGYKRQIQALVSLSQQIQPEMINDGYDSCPSRRINSAIPVYDKPYAGSKIAELIGLDVMKSKCPHFKEWITKLEGLNN